MYKLDLKWFRKSNNLTQIQASEYFGVTQAFISLIERGESKPPKAFVEKILADDSVDKTALTKEPSPQELLHSDKDELILSQQRTIENLTEIVKNLTAK